MENVPAAEAALTSAADRTLFVPRGRRRRAEQWVRSGVSHLILILLSLFALLPLLEALSTALKPKSEIMAGLSIIPQRPTLGHFEFVLGQTDFPTWLRNSLQIAVGTTLCALVIGSLGGYAMSRWRFRGRGLYGNTLLMVQMFPGVMLGIPLFLLLDDYGLIDTLWALLVTYLTFALAFSVWMLKGYFDGIPREIEEAALIDGANRLQVLWQIVLRLAAPGLVTVAVFTFLLAWNEFFFAYIFLVSRDKMTLTLGLFTFVGQYTTEWGYIMAAGILTCLPALVFFFLLQRALTRGLIAGAMKG
ncbi:MAG: carbohydrate ABC transporter permease [Chloroflexi bacterium]|nr:carbohydrate ABC transporter permease [Chloroflexota bacterium]